MHSALASAFRRLVFGLGLLAAAVPGHAQDAATLSPDRVTFFTEPNFQGESLVVEAGASVENLDRLMRPSQRPWAFAISSVRIDGAARATVYSSANYSGDRLEISRHIADLYSERRGRDALSNWDRAIASLAVTGPAPAVVVAPPPPPRQDAPPPTVVVVTPQPPPPVIVQEVRPAMDRHAAEIIVQRAFREVLNRPADPEGLRTYRDRLLREGWTEKRIIEQLQRSSEARSINADDAIKRMYREVLGRDPDANGLAHYRAKWKEGWTQGQIRDDLRRSHEGRNTHIQTAINKAYRELLGRDPDPAGYVSYERLMREKGMSERELRAAIMSGDEYRQRRTKR